MAREKTGIIKTVIISVLITFVIAGLGGLIYGRYSVEKNATKYTKQIVSELDRSLEANRELREINNRIRERHLHIENEIRESRELVNGAGSTVGEIRENLTITRKLIEECIIFIEDLGEIYSEFEKEE